MMLETRARGDCAQKRDAMRAKDVMSVKVVTISCKATVLEAAKLMLDRARQWSPRGQ